MRNVALDASHHAGPSCYSFGLFVDSVSERIKYGAFVGGLGALCWSPVLIDLDSVEDLVSIVDLIVLTY